MKLLQNNFTTPEQSKRLLELGVPADSADCYIINDNLFILLDKWKYTEYIKGNASAYLPCWSVGRLIEILHITYKQDWREYLYLCTTETCNKGLINQIMLYLENHSKDHDFSKLED